jgi:two-component system, cell cycle sensor histidine kinase and response regulator CckA
MAARDQEFARPDMSFAHELEDWVRASAAFLGCPLAMLCLADGEQLTLQASHGLAQRELTRAGLPCDLVLRDGQTLAIEDVRADPRFSAHALVRELPRVRFYASTCLRDPEGQSFGTLAVMSAEPRAITPGLRAQLELLGRAITNAIELRRLRDSRLFKSEAMLNSAQRISGIGCWQWDMVSNEITWSEAMYGIFALPKSYPPSLAGFMERLHPDDREVVAERTRCAIEEGMTDFPDYRIVRPSGEVRVVEASAELERDADGKPWRLTGALFDITERKRAEQERSELTHKMMHAQKLESLGVLSAGVAHDFNNLLVGILGNGELALADKTLTPATRLLIDRVVEAAVQAAGLTRQLSAYTGRGHLRMRDVNLSLHVKGIAELLRASVARSIEFDLSLSDPLPAIRADSDQLQQVTMNLILNAAEAYGEEGAGEVSIRTFLAEVGPEEHHDMCAPAPLGQGRFVVLEVSDHGSGMESATLERIFDPFFSTKFTGRGLGLAAVLGIARSHHAVLTVDSKLGVGTRFRVHFPALAVPAALADQERTRASEPAPSPSTPAKRYAGRTALVIDDEQRVRQVELSILQNLGMRVIEAADGDQALELLRAHQNEIDVALLDLVMPGLDSASTLRGLRSIKPGLPVLVQSGYPEEEAARRLHELDGQLQFIAKPFSPQQLIEKIGKLLH